MIPPSLLTILLPILAVVFVLASAIRILREYERGVVFTLGRFSGVKGPGLILVIPVVQQMVRIDLGRAYSTYRHKTSFRATMSR
jgi:regulator of protease activity HflC (stomatin/prohibitin superfamily)